MKKNEIELNVGYLYILSAPPASGKSTFLKLNNIPSQMIVSTDTLRTMFYSQSIDVDDHGIVDRPFFNDNHNIFSIARRIVRGRLEQSLTTFVDAVSASESDRHSWADIANDLGVKCKVLILDSTIEQCLLNDTKRKQRVGKPVIEKFFNSFTKESSLDYELIDSNTKVSFTLDHLTIKESKLYLIGDTHGLKDEFIQFATTKLGFKFENDRFSHPQGYKMFFLGDFIDRGTQSLEMLQLVKRCVEQDGHYAIIGNHEQKLINFYNEYKFTDKLSLKGKAITQTAAQLLRCSKEEQENLIQFLKKLPHFLVKDNFAFTHAGLRTFDPYDIPKSFCIYGDTQKRHGDDYDNDLTQSDLIYHNFFNEGLNKYYLVRGHNAINAPQSTVTVLEDKIAFGGGFNALDLRLALTKKAANPDEDLNQHIIKQPVSFMFENYISQKLQLKQKMDSLVKNKLGSIKLDDTGLMTVYKYSKSVFFNQSWNASKDLLKCRGLVLDFAGNIVVHPFDKIFNYLEPNENNKLAGGSISDDTPVKIVSKLNGFLGCISKHPFKKDNLLLSTTGTTELFRQYDNHDKEKYQIVQGEYQGYIRDLLKADKKAESKVYRFLQDNQVTLMFEVIHPVEKLNHVIKYEDSEDGLYLIGVRGLNPKDKVWTEEKMDALAKELGLKRPEHKIVSFKEAKEIVNISKDEGVMVREATGDQDYLVKFKTPYYLIIKFLGRMGESNINKMYLQTDVFKQGRNVEEEFYPLIDYLVKYVPRDEFKGLNEDQKKDLVYKIVNEIRDNPNKFLNTPEIISESKHNNKIKK